MVNCIKSETTNTTARDRHVVASINGIECHYALIGNWNDTHRQQQDRASVTSVEIYPERFEEVLSTTFGNKAERMRELKSDPAFVGDACDTVLILDPQTGAFAIGSDGDVGTYLLMLHKETGEIIVERISSPYQETIETDSTGARFQLPNCVGCKTPVMWARRDSWKQRATVFEPGVMEVPKFELLNLRTLGADIIAHHYPLPPRRIFPWFSKSAAPPPKLEDFEVSILTSSDGLTQKALSCNALLVKNLWRRVHENRSKGTKINLASAILDYAAHPLVGHLEGSKDNLSAVILHDLVPKLGNMANCIAVCISDGNHIGQTFRAHDGAVAAQAMIECFEKEMDKTAEVDIQTELLRKLPRKESPKRDLFGR